MMGVLQSVSIIGNKQYEDLMEYMNVKKKLTESPNICDVMVPESF